MTTRFAGATGRVVRHDVRQIVSKNQPTRTVIRGMGN